MFCRGVSINIYELAGFWDIMYSFMSAYNDFLQQIIKLFHQLSGATFGLRFFFLGQLVQKNPLRQDEAGFE